MIASASLNRFWRYLQCSFPHFCVHVGVDLLLEADQPNVTAVLRLLVRGHLFEFAMAPLCSATVLCFEYPAHGFVDRGTESKSE